ncbi:MAG: Rrf2 family transcriptional regulator [Melioribacteraceae bacterium]|nr:Rrf2 family transcriptional regulator [Melioribacteraceae bacterium]MCF8354268.1 Rrf2 family transcriptional regulator [Melioribacteraceae bacterium]MCF8394600.1 Rrf2 family transcriptional regulator [Melioribacteraceae bacterium]MCF8419731.1 Rrf2 family transcriptional regulator [Melioribacteraceae bacterium]
MKFSAQEEYGLRCLIQIGKYYNQKRALTIPEISAAEGISQHNVAKILRTLRIGGFLDSERGQSGGYTLTRPPKEIFIGDALGVLGGRLFDKSFCETHSGSMPICTNTIDCSIRSLWKIVQDAVDHVVNNLTLQDLLGSENFVYDKLNGDYNNFIEGYKSVNSSQ